MAKATTTGTDIGLIGTQSITSDGATTAIVVPAKRLVELVIAVPAGVTATLEASYDAGVTWYTMTPTSFSVIDASAAAKSYAMQIYVEESNIQVRASGTGFGVGDTLTLRLSGEQKT